jgi:hypothetical protein
VILQPGYDFGNEFQFGLDVILRALTGRFPMATPAFWSRHDPAIHLPFLDEASFWYRRSEQLFAPLVS